jgi:glycerol uptake facilitator-like aquaporin
VLILGPVWGFTAIFVGSSLLGASFNENLLQASLNAGASAIGPVLALVLFRLLKERSLRIAQPSDLMQMCLLYALINAVVHHFCWAYQQPEQLLSVSQLPIMVIGDLAGALLGAFLFTLLMRRSGLYPLIERLSKDKPASPP